MLRCLRRRNAARSAAARPPDAMLADLPVPQRQLQAFGAYQAGGADGDGCGRLPAGLVCLHTDREPLVGVKAAVSAPDVPDDPGPGDRSVNGTGTGGYGGWAAAASRMCEAGPESVGAGVRETAI